MHLEKSQQKFDELLSSDGLADSLILWNQLLSYIRRDNGNVSTFWMSYVDRVGDILLGLIRASSRLTIFCIQVYKQFSNGGFSVQLADGNPFGLIPVDQAI